MWKDVAHDRGVTDDDMQLSLLSVDGGSRVLMAHANRKDIKGDPPHNNAFDRQNCTVSVAEVLGKGVSPHKNNSLSFPLSC